ncbi:3D domain-containing protein [Paenibacillus medicaginis]|uniref:3D domain-containing protein n=1 Tax=Paenibacillus medicaginis TaxID=1470560 RepID=A0ABV5BUN9_9BACL
MSRNYVLSLLVAASLVSITGCGTAGGVKETKTNDELINSYRSGLDIHKTIVHKQIEKVKAEKKIQIKKKDKTKPEVKKVNREVVKKEKEHWGIFIVTAYTNGPESTSKRPGDKGYGITASGAKTKEGITVSADIRVLPMGTRIYIEGVGERVVQDTGSAIKGNKLDLFIEDLSEARKFGKQKLKVKILNKG